MFYQLHTLNTVGYKNVSESGMVWSLYRMSSLMQLSGGPEKGTKMIKGTYRIT
jgi:hypothetical protein